MARETSKTGGIVLLAARGPLSNIVVNYFAAHFGPITVLREEPETKWTILRRRARLKGPVYGIGQALSGVVLKVVARRAQARVSEICTERGLTADDPGHVEAIQVEEISVGSVNSDRCRQVLKERDPSVVAVYGTRIIGKRTLAGLRAPFINYHAGITPKYRGQHPAYWALVENDAERAGVSIHLVDEGVDTGTILYQDTVRFSPRDNITTYQYVQMAAALPLFVRAVEGAIEGRLTPQHVDLPSKEWFPPTLRQYVVNGLRKRVW